MSAAPVLFEHFVPGAVIGRRTETVDAAALASWVELYPWEKPEDGLLPPGYAVILQMRAFLNLVAPRPPGNIHAGQSFETYDRIAVGEAVTTEVKCLDKRMKGERRLVELEAYATGGDGRSLFKGVLTLYWAA